MGTLSELKTVVAAYLGVDFGSLIVGGTDLFIVAANNARRNAELLHDFERARISATLSIDGVTGAALGDAVISPSEFTDIKTITEVLRTDGTPVPFASEGQLIAWERQQAGLDLNYRYPSDAEFENDTSPASIVQRGTSIYLYGVRSGEVANPFPVLLRGYGFLTPYDEDTYVDRPVPDFIMEYGYAYMQWSILCELNYWAQKFVPRQEGVLSPPVREKEMAWRDLVLWDSYLIDPNSNR